MTDFAKLEFLLKTVPAGLWQDLIKCSEIPEVGERWCFDDYSYLYKCLI
ncbi:hypothetical protein SPBRAN_465 [uncultured Candidatus Thioglobus sp.]|nr:hypothetical protein SPBRAN_465 [uncultured Candidatus Thioglobus sp.]